MDNWTVIISFNYGHEAHLGQIETRIRRNRSNAAGRTERPGLRSRRQCCWCVKLGVRESDEIRALHSLEKGGFIKDPVETESKLMKQLGTLTSRVPQNGTQKARPPK